MRKHAAVRIEGVRMLTHGGSEVLTVAFLQRWADAKAWRVVSTAVATEHSSHASRRNSGVVDFRAWDGREPDCFCAFC